MRTLPSTCFAVSGAVMLMAAALAQTPSGQSSPFQGAGERPLTPSEAAILRNPWPGADASNHLWQGLLLTRAYRSRLQSLPPEQRPKIPDDGGMGWAAPDAEYWRQMPPEARAIPSDWSPFRPVRFTNTQIDGHREVRLAIQGDYDLWLLSDPLHDLTACISVYRPTRRVWFMEIRRNANGSWIPRQAKDPCYVCHPSGPRLIRPLAENGIDREQLALFNRRMLSYGACDFGDSVDVAKRGQPHSDPRCIGCHNGVQRGRLYAAHARVIRFKVEQDETMPPAP